MSLTVKKSKNHLNSLELDIVDNNNIGTKCLDKKGLHLIERGSDKLAISLINEIRSSWRLNDSFDSRNFILSVTICPNDEGISVSQTSRFKEQSQSQNSGKIPNKILYHLKLKNIVG